MNTIENALSRTTDTKMLEIGVGAVNKTPDVFKKLFPNEKAIIVADTNTWRAAGENVQHLISAAGILSVEPLVIDDPKLYAEWKFVELIENALRKANAIAIAVGSGVINDLTKLASARLNRRYMCVGTAASMDGYTAYGASITFEGNKKTFDCPAPLGFVMDPEIAAKAPYKMSASGYADLIAKIPAAADWMLADVVDSEKINEFAFNVVQGGLKTALENPAEVRAGNVAEVEKLAEGLLLSGFAMQACQSSRPASGIEHQFSHYWDMSHLKFNGESVSHGFKVGIGTLVSTAFLELLLSEDIDALNPDELSKSWKSFAEIENDIRELFKDEPSIMERCIEETKAKYEDADGVKKQLTLLKSAWGKLAPEIKEKIIPFNDVKKRLELVGAPYEPEHIGVTRSQLRDVCRKIPYMRSRFSSVDVAVRAGFYDKWLNFIFGKGGIWEI